MANQSYNEYQLTFMLSMLSNAAHPVTINENNVSYAEQQILAAYNASLPQALDYVNSNASGQTVSIAWGPAVVVAPQDIVPVDKKDLSKGYTATATNTMLVFKTITSGVDVSTYTVAIAGTKASSMFDVLHEDALGGTIQPWPYGSNTGSPKISQGTLTGLSNLLGMTTGGNTVAEFFTTLNDPGAYITVTGHSLGGALAPALALALFGAASNYSKALNEQVESQKWIAQVYATAGPDVGDADYVSYFRVSFPQQTAGASKYEQYNTKIWNSLDIVPQVWSKGFVDYIDTIYTPNATTPLAVKTYVKVLFGLIWKNNGFKDPYAKMDPTYAGQFTGTYASPWPAVSTIINDCGTGDCAGKLDDTLCEFVAQVLYQHIDAYFYATGLTSYLDVLAQTPSISACASTQKLFPFINLGEDQTGYHDEMVKK